MAQSSSSLEEPQRRIIEYLDLQNNPNKDQIVCDLFTLGRRSFYIKYENKLSNSILSKVNSPELLELIKEDIAEIWDARLLTVAERRIQQFSNDVKRNTNQWNIVLTRLVEDGCAHTKLTSQILFLIIQLTFPPIVSEKNEAEKLWIYLTNDGLISLNHFSDDISPEQLQEELGEYSQSPLYLALRDYYKNELKELFEKHLQHIEKKDFYDIAMENLTQKGWLEGIETLRSKIPPRQFRPFYGAISNMVEEQKSKISATIQSRLSDHKNNFLGQ